MPKEQKLWIVQCRDMLNSLPKQVERGFEDKWIRGMCYNWGSKLVKATLDEDQVKINEINIK